MHATASENGQAGAQERKKRGKREGTVFAPSFVPRPCGKNMFSDTDYPGGNLPFPLVSIMTTTPAQQRSNRAFHARNGKRKRTGRGAGEKKERKKRGDSVRTFLCPKTLWKKYVFGHRLPRRKPSLSSCLDHDNDSSAAAQQQGLSCTQRQAKTDRPGRRREKREEKERGQCSHLPLSQDPVEKICFRTQITQEETFPFLLSRS